MNAIHGGFALGSFIIIAVIVIALTWAFADMVEAGKDERK